jgi:hypothetical protein
MKNIFKKKKVLIFSILILIGFFSASFVLAAGISFFGGKIISVTNCSCSEGSQVNITGYPSMFSGTYLYLPGTTQVRRTGNVMSNRLIIGQYTSDDKTCMVGKKPYCSSLPISKGTMKLISTNF